MAKKLTKIGIRDRVLAVLAEPGTAAEAAQRAGLTDGPVRQACEAMMVTGEITAVGTGGGWGAPQYARRGWTAPINLSLVNEALIPRIIRRLEGGSRRDSDVALATSLGVSREVVINTMALLVQRGQISVIQIYALRMYILVSP